MTILKGTVFEIRARQGQTHCLTAEILDDLNIFVDRQWRKKLFD